MTTWYEATWQSTNYPKTYARGTVKVLRPTRDMWNWQPGEIFHLPCDNWSNVFNYEVSNYSQRKAHVLDGETVDQYLTGKEYVNFCDSLVPFDIIDFDEAGVTYRAFSKAFKFVLNKNGTIEKIVQAYENMWKKSYLKDADIMAEIESRNSHLLGFKLKSSDIKKEAKGVVFSRNLKVRMDVITEHPNFKEDNTAAFLLTLVTLVADMEDLDEIRLFAKAISDRNNVSYDVYKTMESVISGMTIAQLKSVFLYELDFELAASL